VIRDSADQIEGGHRHARQPWLSDEAFEVVQQKALAQQRGDKAERRRLQGIFRGIAKRDREAYFESLADAAEEGIKTNNLTPAYRAIR